MAFSTSLPLPINQPELPFIEPWIEQMEFQMEIDEEVSIYFADQMNKMHVYP